MSRDILLDQLFSVPLLYGAQVSPDRKWVAWSWYNLHASAEIYVAPTDASVSPTRLTNSKENTKLVSWAPDSKSIVVGQDHDGDEHTRLFQVRIDKPADMTPLTEAHPPYFLYGGNLHPDGNTLYYAANFDPAAEKTIEASWLLRHELQDGSRRAIAKPLRPCGYWPHLNDAGTHLLYERGDRHPAGRQVWVVDIDGKSDREIVNAGDERKASARWIPGQDRALLCAETLTHTKLGIWDAGTDELAWILDDATRTIEDAAVPRGSRDVIIIEVKDAKELVSRLNLETGEETRLASQDGTLIPLAELDDGAWLGRYYHASQPADLVRFRWDDPRPEAFHSVSRLWEHTKVEPRTLVRPESFYWNSVDGLKIQGWLYRARGGAKGTIVFVHGGPTGHSEDRFNLAIQFLLAQGFNVFDPNYRGSTGFGLAFREAIKQHGWGGLEQEDIRTGIEALVRDGFAQPGKIGMTGTSYGGYSSWWAITHFPRELVAAAAPVCGMTDLVVDYETTRPDLRPYSEEMMGGTPSMIPEKYRERSPIHFVKNIRGKLLIVQGMQDPNVAPENVRAVEVALKRAGISYELLQFADEGHGIAKPANETVLLSRLVDFFARAFES